MNSKDKKFNNSYRGFRYTLKGKKIGFSDSWKEFNNFKNDMYDSYDEEKTLFRLDKTKEFSKENCKWITKEELNLYNRDAKSIFLTYADETLSLKEWSEKLELSLSGIRLRYFRCKDYTNYEILFGKTKKAKRLLINTQDLNTKQIRLKASKMISSYRIKDLKNFGVDIKLDTDWFIENVLKSKCTYCDDTSNLGCDRIYNTKPHTKENVIPCCYICNTSRNNHFTVEEFKLIGKVIKDIKTKRNEEL